MNAERTPTGAATGARSPVAFNPTVEGISQGEVRPLTAALAHVCSAHHWLIATPCGPLCAAVCKRCGATRTFQATVQDKAWRAYAEGHDTTTGLERWL